MGRLIVIEGLDGSGKTTQIACICQKLSDCGADYRRIKLPDYDSPSSALVKLYLGGAFGKNASEVNAYAASSFYAVDRFASYKTVWGNDYHGGKLILADRYTTSNAIYQLSKLPRSEWDGFLDWLMDYEYGKIGLPKPDLVLFLDMPVEVSQKLMSARYSGDENKKDVHEADTAFLSICREAALYASKRYNWMVVPCAENGLPLSVEEIADNLYEQMKKYI